MLIDYFCLIAINGLSLILLILLVGFWRKVRKQFKSPVIFDLIAFFMSVKVVLYFLLPAILRVYSDWSKDREIGAMPSEITVVYAIEFISVVIWMVFIALTLQLPWFGKLSNRLNSSKRGLNRLFKITAAHSADITTKSSSDKQIVFIDPCAKLFMIAICVLYLIYFPYSLEDVRLILEGSGNLLQPVVQLAGPVVGIYLFSLGRNKIGNIAFLLGITVTGMSILSGILSGSRGQVVFAVLWLIFLYLFLTRKKYILYLSIAGLTAIFILHNVMIVIRQDKDFLDKPLSEKITGIIGADNSKNEESHLLSDLEFRFGIASRMSVGFLRLADQGNMAGLQPILSSLYAPIPRKYFIDKPEQGSVDGTKDGMGMYIINRVMDGSSNMSEFFTGVHAYWELGLSGVIMFSALSGTFVAFCIGYFAKFGSVGLPLMMIWLKPPWLEPKLWISETVSHVIHTIIPLIFLWYLVYFFVFSYYKVRELVQIVPAKANM